jgi:hypothetical protein
MSALPGRLVLSIALSRFKIGAPILWFFKMVMIGLRLCILKQSASPISGKCRACGIPGNAGILPTHAPQETFCYVAERAQCLALLRQHEPVKRCTC